MPTKYQFNITADEYDVLRRLAGRIQQAEGITLTEEQIVKVVFEALRQDACVRQVLKKRFTSSLKKTSMKPEE
jgi:hypothetical protein